MGRGGGGWDTEVVNVLLTWIGGGVWNARGGGSGCVPP